MTALDRPSPMMRPAEVDDDLAEVRTWIGGARPIALEADERLVHDVARGLVGPAHQVCETHHASTLAPIEVAQALRGRRRGACTVPSMAAAYDRAGLISIHYVLRHVPTKMPCRQRKVAHGSGVSFGRAASRYLFIRTFIRVRRR